MAKSVLRWSFALTAVAGLIVIAIAPGFNTVKVAPVKAISSVSTCGSTLAQWSFDQQSLSTTTPLPSIENVKASASENGVGSVEAVS
jgi:hypothetical protein